MGFYLSLDAASNWLLLKGRGDSDDASVGEDVAEGCFLLGGGFAGGEDGELLLLALVDGGNGGVIREMDFVGNDLCSLEGMLMLLGFIVPEKSIDLISLFPFAIAHPSKCKDYNRHPCDLIRLGITHFNRNANPIPPQLFYPF
jgi:hypothetical protein